MFGENKNLKDTQRGPVKDTLSIPVPCEAEGFHMGSYTKTHKLITALYMVTDIIDKEEPIRNKLRNLGAEIISDMHLIQQNHAGQIESSDAGNRISETVSFLNIASAMNFISEMNCTILKKEFFELKSSIQEYTDMKPTWLADFFSQPPLLNSLSPHSNPLLNEERGRENSKGHTRIGVQKGSTLLQALSKVEGMKALSDKTHFLSNRNDLQGKTLQVRDFDILKKQRRDDIINIIKIVGKSATIKDIKDKVKIIPEQASFLVSCGEKTLQRELVSMVKEGVLNKTGEKRWSRYFIK